MKNYLDILLNSANDLREDFVDLEQRVDKRTVHYKSAERIEFDGAHLGEVITHSFLDHHDIDQVKMRGRLIYNVIGQRIVSRLMQTTRSIYGDLQAGWIIGHDEAPEVFTQMYEDLVLGKHAHLLPTTCDRETDEDDNPLSFDGCFFVRIYHFRQKQLLQQDGKIFQGDSLVWGSFRVDCGQWTLDKKTDLLIPTILDEWESQ